MSDVHLDHSKTEYLLLGQRYSIVVNANQKVDNYWIRAAPNTVPPGFDNARNSAIFRYKGAPTVDPTTPLVASTQPMVETNLHVSSAQIICQQAD